MFGGGRGMGGGAGSGNMLRLAGRTVATARAGVTNHLQDPTPTSSNTSNNSTSPRATHKLTSGCSNNSNCLSLSSGSGSPFPAHNAPVSANSSFYCGRPSPFSGDDYEWVSLDGNGEEKPPPPPPPPGDDFLLGPVPSLDEVTGAVSALTQVFGASSYSQFVRDKFPYTVDKDVIDQISSPTGLLRQVSSVGAELDWLEPSPHLCNPRMSHSYGSDRVYDAFHLLQTEPSVQRMVISLSSDEAVWDAVLNNEVVRELRETYYAADENLSPPSSESSDETHNYSNPAMDVIQWIRAKFVEVIEKITKLVNELFKPADDRKTAGAIDPFEQRIRTSFLLSIVVLLVVIVTRGQKA